MDLKLIDEIKLGSQEAFESILLEFEPLISKVINSQLSEHGDYSIDKDDMRQVANIALFEACQKYSADKGMSFSSYVYLVIHSRIITYFKSCIKTYNYEYYSLDSEDRYLSNHIDVVCDSAYSYHKEKQFEETLNDFVKSLPKLDQEIIKLKIEEIPYKEIGERLNISTKKVSNRLMRIKKKYYAKQK